MNFIGKLIQIQATREKIMTNATMPTPEIIYTQKSYWDSDFIPSLYMYFDSKERKQRPKKIPLDKHAPKMVTIKELSNLTGISEYCIRKLCKQNKIHFIQTGIKVLINYERFLDYMNGKS